MTVNTRFDMGEMVYLVSDPNQYLRQIIEININPGGFIMYKLTVGTETSWNHEIELSSEKDEVLAITSN